MTSQHLRHIAFNIILVICIMIPGVLALALPEAKAGLAGMSDHQMPDPYPLEHRYNLVKAVQEALLEKGYDPGPIDGIFGPRTRNALYVYQKQNGLSGDGHLTEQTVQHLGIR